MNNKPPSLYLRLWLTPDCHVDLTLRGRITPGAIDRLIAFLKLTLETPEAESIIPEDEEGEGLNEQ